MDKIVIESGPRLNGEVTLSGAKNAVLPIMAASLLTDEVSRIRNVPRLRDVSTMIKILREMGVKVQLEGDVLEINPNGYEGYTAPYRLVSTMRASICVLGPLVAKQKRAEVSMPGGCVIGSRPIDLHIKGLRALGADVKIERGYILGSCDELVGSNFYLGGAFGSSVTATANCVMAATLAEGLTVIENAACEPEVVDLIGFLNKMGARIKGAGSHRLEIEGVDRLSGADHTVIPDRIEAGSFIFASAITGGEILIKKARIEHLGAVVDKLEAIGVEIKPVTDGVKVRNAGELNTVNCVTLPFPGFPTDLQAQLMALMSIIDGISVITEKIYPDRFIHVSELSRMGADVILERPSAIIRGGVSLSGAPVMASDLRASAALILAGLVARGRTEIHRIYHLDRGYEKIEEKLAKLGAKIWREKE